MPANLSLFLSPKSIAIIGASRTPEKVGAIVLKNLVESKYSGHIYPVNPNTDTIASLPCFKDIASLPEIADLAIVALPASAVNPTLIQIGDKGIKNVVVYSAGFKEMGDTGKQLETEFSSIAAKYNLNILGPNCLGFVNNDISLNATFGQSSHLSGNLRFISQSGAIAASLFDWCQSIGLGFSQFITLGNKAVLTENDFLSHFLTNPSEASREGGLSSVSPIGLYLESISHGPEFINLTKKLTRTDPVFIIKPGKTPAAAVAMQSHTGAIAGEDSILDAALTQAGVMRCDTLEDFFDLSRSFAWENAPEGPKIAIISNAGGPAVISADAVSTSGLQLAELSEEIKTKLFEVLPRSASVLNPIDVLGDALADRYAAAAEIILQSNLADSVLFILTPQIMTQVSKTAQIITDLSKKYGKPIFCSFIGGNLVHEGEQILNLALIPSFRFPERAISAIGSMWKWHKSRLAAKSDAEPSYPSLPANIDNLKKIVTTARNEHHRSLDNLEANDIVSGLNIPTPPTASVTSFEEAKNFAQTHGWPVVLKFSSPEILHKSNFGGVILDIWNDAQLETAWDNLNHHLPEIPATAREHLHFQIQKEVTNGIETIIGIKHDPTFGPVLLFGAGGHLAELVADKNLKILPISRDQAKQLVSNSRVFNLFKTHPGEPEYALDKLYDLIVNLTSVIPLLPDITDIEINPVIVTHNDVWAVDSKVLLTGLTPTPAAASHFHTATCNSNIILAAKFHYLDFESQEPMIYQPGQYVSVKVAPNRINSYSIASHTDDHHFQLLVDTSPGGPGSKFFENLKSGDKIAFIGPFGIFTYKPDDGAKHLLFFGTGSGCSPLRSILEAAIKNPDLKIDFYFGLRHSDDVFWQDYFQKLQEKNPNFRFTLSLSQPDESWHGRSGHITDLLNQELIEGSDCSAYLCGNQKMIDQASQILLSKNCPEKRIYTEKF